MSDLVRVDVVDVDHGRLEAVHDECLEGITPADDVDTLTAQLVNDGFDARAPHPNACTDTVDLRVRRHDGHLRAIPGLSDDALDLDDIVCDLGHFQLKQTAHQVGVCAGNQDLDAASVLAHLDYDGANAIAGGVGLTTHPVVLG